MTMYVYDGETLVGRITRDSREECWAVFAEQFGSNDYALDSHGDNLCAVEFEF